MQKFLRTLVLVAFMVMPMTMQGQNAKVSEYDYTVGTATFTSVASTGTAWTADDVDSGYVDVTMPFSMYFGENQVQQGDVLRVYPNGSATFTNLDGSLIAPMYYSTGYLYGNTSIHTSSTSASLTIEWRKIVAGSSSYSFQLKLYSTGNIRFCYGPMTLNSSISVLVGMRSSATDQFLCSGNNWSEIVRTNSWTASHTVNATNAPAYNLTTGEGLIYTFTQPACVKPTAITAEATAWNTVNVGWTVAAIGSKYEIAYSTDPDFDASAAGVTRVTVNQGTADSYDVTGLQGSTTYYFAVRKYCGSTPSGWLYGASATTPSGCPTLSGISSSNVTATGATLNWQTSVPASAYEVRYNLGADFDPDNNEGTLVTSTDLSKTLTGLAGASTYYYYVRANCVSGLTTDWYGPYSFNTLCSAITVDVQNPYVQTFSENSMPMCWNEEVVTGSDHWTFSNNQAHFSYTPGASARLITPVFNLNPAGAYQVEFYHAEPDYSGGVDSLWLCYRTSTTGEWVRLAEYGSHSSTLEHVVVLLPNPSATYQLAFVSSAEDYLGMAIANVVVRTQPTCPAPTDLAATEEGVVTWTANTNNTSYDIVYGLSGFTTVEEGTLIQNVTGTTYTIAGLAGSSTYDIYIRAHCSATNEISEGWVGPVTINTPCPAVSSFPWIEDFESYTYSTSAYSGATELPTCWNVFSDFSLSRIPHIYRSSNNNSFEMTAGTSNCIQNNIAVLPPFSQPLTNLQISFDCSRESGQAATLIFIGYVTNANDTTTFVPLTEITGVPSSFTHYEYSFAGNTIPAGARIALKVWRSSSYYWARFDNVRDEIIPTCIKPTNLAAMPNATASSVTASLSWTENTPTPATQWEVRYWKAGTTDTNSVVANANPYTLSYLEMGATYNWQVRSLCSATDQSDWSVVSNFSIAECLSGPVIIGNGTGNTTGVPVANYGSTYCQQIFTAAELIAAGLTAGEINSLSFDWSAVESSYDKYFSIYLANTTQSSFASTSAFVPFSDLTMVYGPQYREHGTISTGVEVFNFTTNFVWDGTSNIVVATLMNAGASDGNSSTRARTHNTGVSNISMFQRKDGSQYTDEQLATITGSSRSTYRANIVFNPTAPCNQGECVPPTVAITVGPDGDNAKADLTFSGGEDAYGYVYGPAGFTPNIANGVTVTGNTATITPLAQETTYDLYVYSVCTGVDNPRMVRYSFTTPFVPTCKPQANFATSNVTYTGVTVTWQQEDPNQVPEGWTVRYSVNGIIDLEDASTYTEVNVTTASLPFTGLHNGDHIYMYTKATCNAAQNDYSVNWSSYNFTLPTIEAPTALTNWHITNSTDSLSWTEATEGINSWTVRYNAGADFDPDGTEGQTLAATTAMVKLTGLEPYINYFVYVRANSGDEHSAWSTLSTFKTKCPDGGELALGDMTGNNSYLPLYTLYDYSFTEQIYTAEDLGAATQISSISYYVNSANTDDRDPVQVYMANTAKTAFESTTDWVSTSNMTLVYDGPMVTSQTGWHTLEFATPFAYDGTNLIIAVNNDDGNYQGTANFGVINANGNQALRAYRDNTAYDPTNPGVTGSLLAVKNNFIFGANCNTDVTCFAPASISAEITPANVVTLNWAPRTDLEPIVNNYQVKYGLEGFDPDNQGTLIDNLNGVTTTTINGGLAAEQNYDVYVRTVCGGSDYSNWTKGTFVTYPTCWAPVNVTVTATTQNSATLSWSNDSIAPTAGTRWEVAYGLQGFNPNDVEPIETTNNETFLATDLRHSSKYEFYVRTKCGVDDYSPWSAVATGTTQCGVWSMADLPLTENFDGVTGKTSGTEANHVLPNCWDYSNDATSSSYVGYPICYNSSSYSRSGNNHLRFYTNYSSSSTNYGNQIAIFPPMDFDVDTLNLEFYARKYSTSTTYQSNIIVGVMSDPDDASTFVEVATLHPTSTTYEPFLVEFSEYQGNGRYIAIKAERVEGTSGYNYVLIDDVTLKLREKVNFLPNNGSAMTICQEFVQLDTANGTYANNLNATYVIRPAEAGKVVRINGSYDLENGYDFLYVYRGEGANKVIVDTLTGSGDYEFRLETNDWVNYGAITLVMKSDADNALPYGGFKFMATCECPAPAVDMPVETVEANGSYTWTEGNGETYVNHATTSYASDRVENIDYTFTNVAGCDSVYRHLALTIHPDYTLNYAATICERDEYEFYGNTYSEAGTYTVTLQSVTGADSTGILALTVNSAPAAYIQYNNRTVTELANMCDNYDMTLNARSNFANATFLWEDNSTAAARIVNPHESNVYTVVAVNPATGCTSLPASVTVTTTPVPALTISGDSEICYGQSATLTLVDANEVPATYRWSNNSTATSITVSPTETTTYTVSATSTTGSCVATAEFTVVVNALPVVEVSAAPAVVCQNDMITLTASKVAGYRYGWSTGNEGDIANVAASSTGSFTLTVTDQNGCVNEFTTNNVTVNPVYELNDEQSACVGMLPVTWGTQSLFIAGSYNQSFNTVNGCDSTVHLTFIVQDTANNNSYRELCEGATFTFGTGIYEQQYTATENTVISYVDTTSGECPARYNLYLTVNTHNPATVENTVCDSYVWPLTGETYTESGAYQTMLKTTKGCDSLVTLNLTVNYKNTGIDEQVACDSYEWIDGNTYTADNNSATYTLRNVYGCDSVVTLKLAVNYRSYHEDFHRVCDAPNFTWDDNEVYSLDVELADSIQHITGENIFGCYEIALLHLDMNYVSDRVTRDTVVCDEFTIDTVSCDYGVETAYLHESGVYTLRVHNDILDRDEILTLNLTVIPSNYHTNVVTSCLPYTWNVYDSDSNLYEIATIKASDVNGASVYTMSFDMAEAGFATAGCSNIEVLRLTPIYPSEEVVEATICQNGIWYSADSSVSYNGYDYNIGLNTLTWSTDTNAAGCLHYNKVALTVNPVVADTVNMTYCESQFIYTDNDVAYLNYIEGNDTLRLTIPATGLNETVYTNTLVANWETEAGCARTVTVNYTVNPVISETDTVKAFLQYVWDANDKLYEGVGHYTDVVWYNDPVTGCRASRVLDLEISDYIRIYDTIIVCTQYELDGKTYYEDNTFEEQLNENTIHYTTYHVTQRTLTDVNIVTNQPYTWINGETYTANASNVYYSVPSAVQGECDDVYRLTLTMTAPISICEGQLPYTTAYGFVIDAAENGVYTSITTDTIIAYTVKLNTSNAINKTACDSYTWHGNTYTEGGSYNFDTVNAAGCDSTVTLNLTINNSTAGTVDVTVCDSYTWHGSTYSQSGSYTFDTVNAAGCDSTATLALVINKNNGVTDNVTACDSYTWNGVTYTADANVTKTFNDVNGCAGDSVLNLTVNYSVSSYPEMIVNAASTYYLGVLYEAPTNDTITSTIAGGAANGCDSIINMHLQVKVGDIIQIDTVYCGDFTWIVEDSVIATYTWIPMAQRTNPVFNYAKITETGLVPVEDFPVYETYSNGIVVNTYVLHLTMVEARTEYKEVTVLLSNDTYTDPADTSNHVFDFAAEKAAGQNATKLDTLHYSGSIYCDSIVYYTFNLVYNYVDDATVTVCYTDSVYTTQNGTEIALTVGENVFTDTTAAGTANEMVHNKVYVRMPAIVVEDTTAMACDQFVWYGTTYTETPATMPTHLFQVVKNGVTCDSLVTLNLTINHSSTGVKTATACLTYTWEEKIVDGAAKVYTESNSTDTIMLTNLAGCDSTVTLNLTINPVNNSTVIAEACDSYTWTVNSFNTVSGLYEDVVVGTYTETSHPGEATGGSNQNVDVVIGDNTSTTTNSAIPGYSLYDYSISQQIYTADEIGMGGYINSLTMWLRNTSSYERNLEIYVKEVSESTFEYNTAWVSLTADDLVATGTMPNEISDPIEKTFAFNTPFAYTGTGNLLVCVRDVTGSWSSGLAGVVMEANGNQAIYAYRDGTAYDPTNVGVNGNLLSKKDVIGLNFTTTGGAITYNAKNQYGCDSLLTLDLTVNHSFTGTGDDIDTLGASVTLTDKNGSYLFLAPYDGDTTLVYQTEAGCDSIVTFHITVNQFQIVAENEIKCGMYTWNEAGHGTGHTYKWISDAEKTAYAINIPGVSPMLPLYKDVTTGNYIYNRPMDTVGNTVYMLNLNLNEAQFVDSTIALFPQSVETLTLHGETLDFTGMTSASKPTADTTVSILLPNDDLCGTWMTYNVHVVYNYRSDSETLCYTDSYTWEDGQTETLSVGSQTITKTLYVDNWDSLRVVTRTITVRANNNTYEFDQEACDSYTWNDSVYTTSGDYTQNFTDQYGCDSVATLHLTMKYNTDSVQTLAGCDSVLWHGIWYYADNDSATYVYTSGNGCPSVTTLNLTINHNEPQVTYDTACHIYTWSLNSNQYDESGVYTAIRTDGNTCQAVDTVELTIRQSSSYDSVMYVTDGSYLYIDQNNNPTLITSGNVATFAEHYTNAAGCDSTVNIEIHVGSGVFFTEDTSACNSFTWRDGNTYVWISAEERAAHGNALYKNQTTGAYVMSNPIYNAPTDTFDVIYMLRLNLTQNKVEYHTINFPISLGTLTYGDSTFNFETSNEQGREFVNTIVEREVHFASDYYCDSIHYLTINLQNNYSEVIADAADICVTQSSYTWRNHTINTATTDFDHAHTYYIYDTVGTAEAPVVEYIRVTQHPVVYATERRTACDSYTWNGTVYTESTSGATFDTVDMWGCDSTVTLLLTVNHNSSSAEETTVCDTYTWTAGNGQSYTYTESGVYLSDVYLTNKGCESRDTLRLTVNNTTNNAYTADECGSYTWNGTTYTESGDYTFDYTNNGNCPSVDTLHLTIRNTTNQGYTQVACDSYEWHDSTYLESTTAYYEYENGNGCVSVDTLYLTINASTTATVYDTVCDSYNWQTGDGNTYIQSGTYVWHTTNGNNCAHDVSLHLTVNNSTHNSESAVACDTYTWHNTEYTTGGVKTYEYNNGFCASVDTLHLTLYHSDYDGVNYANQTVNDWCGDYTWIVNDSVVGVYTESVETSTRITSPVTTCDSIIFLNLTIKHAPVVDTVATVCANTLPYVWRGIEMNAAGSAKVRFPLENGCDSLIRFTLTVNPKYDTALMANICLGSGFEGYNFNIPAEQLNTLGEHVFVDSLTSVNGCDSIVTLTVNVKTYYNTTVEYTACDEFLWDLNGETYNLSGNYNHTIIAVNNCDSVVTLALTINNSTTGVDEQTACNRYTWIDGETYTASNNTATFTMENAAGCDSVITLDLTVNYSNNYEFADVACDVYTWNGATYSQSGDYTYAGTNMDGCDSVVTMHLTVNNSTTSVVTDEACESYTWETGNGQTYTESGNYTFAIVNGNAIGCDSVITLALNIKKATTGIDVQTACENFTWMNGETYYASNNEATYTLENAAGCDSVVNLNLTINYDTYGNDEQSACESFTWIDGETYYASNDEATYTLTNANGCDSVVTLRLTINTPSTGIDVQTACDTYTWMDGNVYTASNNEATYTLANADMNGCDSIVTLNLTINNSTTSSEVAATCGEFEWHGQSYSQNGLYTFDTINALGCDSTVYLSLVVNQSISTTSEATACDSYEWNGETYTESGVYTFTSQTDGGCESIATLLLTIKKSTNNAENVTVCDNYTWNNTQYSTSGDYTYSYTNAAGCASTDTLHLTINASTTETVNAIACDSYTWQNGNGNTYLQSGTYTWNTTNANNCNHVVTLNLTINNATSSTVTETACNSFVWNGQTYTETGVYTWNGTNAANCDSVATLMLMINQPYASSVERTACESYTWTTGNGQTYTQSGNYDYTTTALNGCDSVVTLVLTINTPANTTETLTACDSLTWLNGNGQLYTESGVYTYNFTDNNGCQATSTLNLTINQHVDTYAEAEDCSSYTWSVTGETYTESGVYTAAITDGNNCAATAHLTLAINGGTSELMTVTACDAFTWTEGNGQTYTETPAYSVSYNTLNAHGCPHVIYLDLTINHSDTVVIPVTAVGSYTWNDTTLTSSGTYFYNTTNVAGCDSIVTLLLTIEQPVVKYYVTLLSDNASMGVVSGSANDSVVENTVFTATATANDGYQFVYWMSNTGDVITENPYSFQVTSDMTLTAYFEAVLVNYTVSARTYTVIAPGDTLIDQQGSILGTGVYESGTTATLTAQADSGYHFLYWSNGLSTATITFTVTGDIELIAYFEKDAEPQAVEVADMDNVVIFSNDTRIIVRGAEGHDVTVFDVNGRMISRKLNAADEVEFRMAATGVYLVKVGNAPAKRVLVVR